MKHYDVTCPICGHVNRGLYLEETNGWMECEKCLSITKSYRPEHWVRIPVISMHGAVCKAPAASQAK